MDLKRGHYTFAKMLVPNPYPTNYYSSPESLPLRGFFTKLRLAGPVKLGKVNNLIQLSFAVLLLLVLFYDLARLLQNMIE